MEKTVRKSVIIGGIKTGLFSLIFACVGVLVLALLAKLFNISDGVLPIINQILKALAVFLGTLMFVKDEKYLVKALLGAVIYWVLSFVVFSLLGGSFHWGQIFLDLAISLAASVAVALLKSRKS